MERSIPELPFSKLCAVPFALQKRAPFKGEKRAKKRGVHKISALCFPRPDLVNFGFSSGQWGSQIWCLAISKLFVFQKHKTRIFITFERLIRANHLAPAIRNSEFRKSFTSVNFRPQFWAGNGCTNFMGARHFWVLSAGKPPRPQNSSF